MDINLMISIFPSLLNGAVITLKLLASSMFFGLLIGLLFAILRINKNPIINKFAYGYSYFFRGTPLLVQLYLIYYGLANIEATYIAAPVPPKNNKYITNSSGTPLITVV